MRPALLLVLAAPAALAQTPDPHGLTLGLGLGGNAYAVGHPTFYVSHQRGPLVGTVQLSGHALSREVPNGFFSSHRDRAAEAALLVGGARDVGRRVSVRLQTGVAVVKVSRAPAECWWGSCAAWVWPGEQTTTRLGLPLEASAATYFRSGLGIGLRAFANVNPIESYAGVGLDLRVHPLRRR